jgi:hypothetical protein
MVLIAEATKYTYIQPDSTTAYNANNLTAATLAMV